MLDRKRQIEGILESFQATKQKLMKITHVISDHGQIPYSQWMVLHIIYHNEGIGIKELSHMLGISSSAATQLVNNLVKKGTLVCEKSAEDHRALKIRVAKNTKELLEVARTQAFQKIKLVFDTLSDEELEQLSKLSKKVADNILEQQDN
jgi:DNA-binding MarR family transcriptional regulator